jgi:hypothetical protein
MSNVRVALTNIINKVRNSCNTNDRWVVKKMKQECVNRIVTILPFIYQKNMVEDFSNKCAMMISEANHGKSMNWATIMYF